MGDVCISISATDEVLNCKDTVASFATVLSGCLVSMADHKVTNHLMACHGHVDDIIRTCTGKEKSCFHILLR